MTSRCPCCASMLQPIASHCRRAIQCSHFTPEERNSPPLARGWGRAGDPGCFHHRSPPPLGSGLDVTKPDIIAVAARDCADLNLF